MRLARTVSTSYLLRAAAGCCAAAAVLVACHTSERAGADAPSRSEAQPAAEAPDAPAASVTWRDMTKQQRLRHMKTVVFPAMKTEFQRFDAKDFAEFACATCHGHGAADKTFKMPNPDLPKLPTDEAGFRQLAADEPDAVNFMKTTVVPRMAQMLSEPPYDPATQQGFGCFRCHTPAH